jgi:hypothetical protein
VITQPPQSDEERLHAERRGNILAALMATAVAITFVATVAIKVTAKHSGARHSATAISPLSASAGTSGVTDSSQPTATQDAAPKSGPSEVANPPPVTPAASSQRYVGPGGISISATSGWTRDTSAGIRSVSDYVQPPATDRLRASYFRIGIGNSAPESNIQAEAADAVTSLRSQDSGVEIVSETFGRFLGADSVDIEFANYHNSRGLLRHALERLWIDGGVTHILKFDSPAQEWDPSLKTFNALAANCQLAQS